MKHELNLDIFLTLPNTAAGGIRAEKLNHENHTAEALGGECPAPRPLDSETKK